MHVNIKFMDHLKYLSDIGKVGGMRGGKSTSRAKIKAAKRNAAKARAARVAKYPPCPTYKNKAHRFNPAGLCFSPECRAKYPDLRQGVFTAEYNKARKERNEA
jgi:hypothetical protein